MDNTALATIDPASLAVSNFEPQDLRAIIVENTGGQLTAFDLTRIRIPTGGTVVWDVGDVPSKTFDAVIVYKRGVRVYWSQSVEDGGGHTPPDCKSDDLEVGIGKPGGACASCPLNDFGTSRRGAGKACRETQMLFVLPLDSLIPSLLIAPPTSLKQVRTYMLSLASKGTPYYGVVTQFTLDKVEAGAQSYSRLVLKRGPTLPAETLARIRALSAAIAPSLSASVPSRADVSDPPAMGQVPETEGVVDIPPSAGLGLDAEVEIK